MNLYLWKSHCNVKFTEDDLAKFAVILFKLVSYTGMGDHSGITANGLIHMLKQETASFFVIAVG